LLLQTVFDDDPGIIVAFACCVENKELVATVKVTGRVTSEVERARPYRYSLVITPLAGLLPLATSTPHPTPVNVHKQLTAAVILGFYDI